VQKFKNIQFGLYFSIIFFILPLIFRSNYSKYTLVWFCIYCMLAVSLRFIMLVGAVNFAHAGFMGIGAYVSAVLMMRLGLSFWITFILGALVSAIFAAFFGIITLRLKGAYFFLVSFALVEIIRVFFSSYFVDIFGGVNGLIGVPPPNGILWLHFDAGSLGLLYLIGVITVLVLFSVYLFEKSYWGKVFNCINESDNLAQSIGINILKYKVIVFIIGCFIAGVAGSLYGCTNGVITPDDFTYELSLFLLVCVVLGGMENILGTVLSVSLLVVIRELFRSAAYFEPIIWGLSLILILLFAPRGLFGLGTNIFWIAKSTFRSLRKKEINAEG